MGTSVNGAGNTLSEAFAEQGLILLSGMSEEAAFANNENNYAVVHQKMSAVNGGAGDTAVSSSVHLLTQRQHSVGVKFPVIAHVKHSLQNLGSVLSEHRKQSSSTNKYGGVAKR